MTRTQLARRNAIVARHDAALSRWPQGRTDAFRNEVLEVASSLEALANEADADEGDRLERARTWRLVALAYADVAVGQPASWLDAQIADLRKRVKYAAPASGGWQTDLPDLPDQLRKLVQEAANSGTLPATHQLVLGGAIEEIADMIAHPPADVQGMLEHGKRLEEASERLARVMGETGQIVPSASRAAAVWKDFAALKTEIYRSSVQQHAGIDSKMAARELYRRCAEADTIVHQHGADDEWVGNYEHDVLRPLAAEVRAHLLRNHLAIARPVWPSSSQGRDMSAVFFAGSEAVEKVVDKACVRGGLSLRRAVASRNYAAARWDALARKHAFDSILPTRFASARFGPLWTLSFCRAMNASR